MHTWSSPTINCVYQYKSRILTGWFIVILLPFTMHVLKRGYAHLISAELDTAWQHAVKLVNYNIHYDSSLPERWISILASM